ncbi:MAG: MBL fold metallo-hydrolase [Actinobacteria bacterium]|nr:MBL fold metallo-hydrolase [Actinomycetota bacterium]
MKIVCAPVGPLQANCYLVSDDEGVTCVIDPGGEAERLVQIMEKRGLVCRQILLTHGHFDHMGGAADLARLTGAPIACSPDMAPMLRDPDRYIPFPGFEGTPGRELDQALHEDDVIAVGRLQVTAIETPGHSPGDMTFEIGGNLFCGDLLFRRSVGRTDFPGGDFDTLLASVAKLMRR